MTTPQPFNTKGITFQFVIREDKKDRHGKSPLFLRITRERKISLQSVGLKVKAAEWDKNRGRVNRSHPNSVRFNANLEQLLQKAEENLLKTIVENRNVSAKGIKETLTPKKAKTVQELLKEKVQVLNQTNNIGTSKRYKVVLNKINTYMDNKELTLHEINYAWLEGFEYYLIKQLNNQVNTVHSSTKVLRALMNEAVRRGDIEVTKNPFTQFKLKKEGTNIQYLSETELTAFKELEIDKSSQQYLHQQLFLFAAYGGGIRISDLLTLKHNQIKDGRIYLVMRKTNKQMSFALPEPAIKILHALKTDKTDGFLFPFLSGKEHYNEARLYNAISSYNTLVNKSLKLIATKLEWSKRLHFHMSRHTFATLALSKGIRIEYVSAILGHSTIQETQRYAKVGSNELDKAMELIL